MRHKSDNNIKRSLKRCLLGKCACFLSSADIFQNQLFRKKYFKNTIRVSNSLDSDQARQNVGPDLGLNCLQRFSADDTSRLRVKSQTCKFMTLLIISQLSQFLKSTTNIHYLHLVFPENEHTHEF